MSETSFAEYLKGRMDEKDSGNYYVSSHESSAWRSKSEQPSQLDIALNKSHEQYFPVKEIDELKTKFLTQLSLNEKYEMQVKIYQNILAEADGQMAGLLIRLILTFSIILILAAIIFGKYF